MTRAATWAGRLAGALVAAAILVGLAAGALGQGGVLVSGAPSCPFLRASGAPCPFCGLTRATVALGAGDLAAALRAHPLGPLLVLAMLALGVALALGRRPPPLRVGVAVAAVAGIWAARLLAA